MMGRQGGRREHFNQGSGHGRSDLIVSTPLARPLHPGAGKLARVQGASSTNTLEHGDWGCTPDRQGETSATSHLIMCWKCDPNCSQM